MLRRQRQIDPQKNTKNSKKSAKYRKKECELGSTASTDDDHHLEKLVLGGEDDVVNSLIDHKQNRKRSKDKLFPEDSEPVPVWEDDDDDEVCNVETKSKRLRSLQNMREEAARQNVPQDTYRDRLKQEFTKVVGTPSWARLQSERARDSASEDESDEEILKSTGSYLDQSTSLPRGLVQLKRCPDANKEQPSEGKLKSVEFHPSAQVLLTAGMNQTLCLFQIDGKLNTKIQSVFVERFPIHTAHFSTNGHEVVMGSMHKSFYYYDMMAGKVVNVPKIKGLEERNMAHFEVSPDGKLLAFLGSYGHIHFISTQSKEWISSVKMNGSVNALTFNRDGSRMYSIGDDGEVYVWDMSTRDCIHRFIDEGCLRGTSIAMSHNNQYLACGSYSGVVNVYEDNFMQSTAPTPLKAVMNLTTPCTSMKFNASTEILALSSNYTESAIKLVHFPSLTVFSNFPAKEDNLRIPLSLDFSLNGGYFSVGNHRGQALLYRVKHYDNY